MFKQPVNKANLLDETAQWFFYFLLNLINTPNQELNSLMRPFFDLRNNTIYFFQFSAKKKKDNHSINIQPLWCIRPDNSFVIYNDSNHACSPLNLTRSKQQRDKVSVQNSLTLEEATKHNFQNFEKSKALSYFIILSSLSGIQSRASRRVNST